jgi:hypothetical protein
LVSVQGQAEEVTVIIRIIVFDGEFFFLYFLESGFLIKQMCSVRILKTGKAKAIRFSTLEAICKVLNCQPADILEYRDEEL